MSESRSCTEYLIPRNNIIVLDSYFKLTNKSYLIHRFWYDSIRFFDHFPSGLLFWGQPVFYLVFIDGSSHRDLKTYRVLFLTIRSTSSIFFVIRLKAELTERSLKFYLILKHVFNFKIVTFPFWRCYTFFSNIASTWCTALICRPAHLWMATAERSNWRRAAAVGDLSACVAVKWDTDAQADAAAATADGLLVILHRSKRDPLPRHHHTATNVHGRFVVRKFIAVELVH